MCSHYETVRHRQTIVEHFGAALPEDVVRWDIWPGYESLFVRHTTPSAGEAREVCRGLFGLVPYWATDSKGTRYTYNARSETIADKPSFRDAWRRGQHCIIPAQAIFEPDWRTGKAVSTRIERADGAPMGIAGLWAQWRAPGGETVLSFTMLTINAETHPLMRSFHKPADEKRMVVILPEAEYQSWLEAPASDSAAFLAQYPAELLSARPAQPGQ